MAVSAWAAGATRSEAQAQVTAAVAHAKKVGKEFVKDFAATAQKGEGWVATSS